MESSIAAFLLRWSACELLPTAIMCVSFRRTTVDVVLQFGPPPKHKFSRKRKLAQALLQTAPSTVLAQDHFYSDFLSLSLTILTHKGSLMITLSLIHI